MKQILILFLFLSSTLLYAQTNDKPSWPQKPAKPRIIFDKVIQKADDLSIKKGFFSKVFEFVFGEENQALIKPFGIYIDTNDILYVTDTASQKVFIFNEKGNQMHQIEGTNKENFQSPIDVKTDEDGNIYISDSILGYVFVFDNTRNFLYKIGNNHTLKRPTGIAINNLSDQIYIADTLNNSIEIFSLKGEHIKSFGNVGNAEGQFNKPTFINIDKKRNLYVSDSMNQRVQIFDEKGTFLRTFGQRGKSAGTFANPRGITVDINGNIFVTDTLFNAIQVFNNKGQLLMLFGREGTKNGEFSLPAGITISDKNKIYIADSYNMRVQSFDLIRYKDEE